MSEVVRRALAVYEFLVENGGRSPSITLEGGETRQVLLY